MGSFERNGIFKAIILYRVTLRVDPHRIQVFKLLPDSSSAVAYGTAAGHFPKQLTPTHPFPEETLVV